MRQSLLLSGESLESFLKVLAFFEKKQVVASVEEWQVARTVRNLAAHTYEIAYGEVAEHFNTLHSLKGSLYRIPRRFVGYSRAWYYRQVWIFRRSSWRFRKVCKEGELAITK